LEQLEKRSWKLGGEGVVKRREPKKGRREGGGKTSKKGVHEGYWGGFWRGWGNTGKGT